jgi:hypothetical protein
MQDMLAVRNQFDPHGGRASGSREMLASKTAEYGGEMLYINKSKTKPLWAHEYNRDEGARKFWNGATAPFHIDAPLYNRDQDSFTLQDIYTWDDYFRARPGTGKRVSSGGVNISWIDENSHFRGDNNYRRSGEVDAMRIPKDAFYAHQVMWDGWVEPEHPRVHITGHWNYPAGTKRTVYVVANTAGEVELKLNGHSLGRQHATHDFLYTFPDISYEPGELEAIAYDEKGRATAHTRLTTAGAPVQIRLTPHTAPNGMHADGEDLALVDVEVVDAKDQRVPTALDLIHFKLDGPAEWRGGIAQGSAVSVPVNSASVVAPGMAATSVAPFLHQDNYILSKDLPVEGGVNRVSIRSTTKAGAIELTATADGLKPAHITLTTQSVAYDAGLTTFDPAAALPLGLKRGTTPEGSSFHVTRIEIPISGATSGTNAKEAARSYDDDETSFWSNASTTPNDTDTDGLPIKHIEADKRPIEASLQQAWIEYTFAQRALPNAIDLKLASFRLRRYPLRITLDGATVYDGLTPTSLGYVTLPLNATKAGTKLRIELTSAPTDVQETHALIEVNGKIDQAEPTGKAAKPVLSILEAEIYSSPRK